jgi:alkylation response protein AidB-like acyl-CoA dehydrogenase
MNLDRDDIEVELAAAARSYLDQAWTTAHLRQSLGQEPLPAEPWKQVSEMGWLDVLVNEADGGLGLGPVAAGAIAEESGRALFPGPLVDVIVLRGALSGHGWFAEDGLTTYAAAEAGSRGLAAHGTVVLESGRLRGEKVLVPYADHADRFVVLAQDQDEPVLALVDASACAVTAWGTVDPVSRLGTLALDGVEPARVLVGDDARAAYRAMTDLFLCLTAARLLGVAQRVVELSVDYARVRHQFGRPIGSFQAVRHRLADMHTGATTARSACYLAQAELAAGVPNAGRAAQVAKAYIARVGRRIAEDGLQIHGGIGFTYEHDLHLYFNHILTLQGSWGDEGVHEEALGQRLLAGAR